MKKRLFRRHRSAGTMPAILLMAFILAASLCGCGKTDQIQLESAVELVSDSLSDTTSDTLSDSGADRDSEGDSPEFSEALDDYEEDESEPEEEDPDPEDEDDPDPEDEWSEAESDFDQEELSEAEIYETQEEDEEDSPDEPDETLPEDELRGPLIDEDGTYTSKEDVALYIHTYGKLPSNFITKKQAKKLGWSGGSLEDYAPGKCIGGDYFGNYEGLLPKEYEYRECDIDTLGKKKRGAKRIIYCDEGYIYYTDDHYESFEMLYSGE